MIRYKNLKKSIPQGVKENLLFANKQKEGYVEGSIKFNAEQS